MNHYDPDHYFFPRVDRDRNKYPIWQKPKRDLKWAYLIGAVLVAGVIASRGWT